VRVLIRKVGTTDTDGPLELWPRKVPVPRLGDLVTYRDGTTYRVHAVVWYPEGDENDYDEGDPRVYVVLRVG
jgi:hypothetical protein